jgi:C1A family cysteine protease
MAFSTNDKNLKGCLFGPPSPKDFRTMFKAGSIPDKVDLRQYCTAVEDQGQLGSCTANATVGAMEFLYRKRDGQSLDLSRLFTYYNSRRMRGTTNQDTGAYISDATASILAFGVCREDVWPYDISTFANEPSQQAYQEAMIHEAIQYARVDGAEGAVGALASGFPVVFGTRIPERCYQEAASNGGVFPMATDAEIMNNQGGGHCMLIVGYDKPKQVFIVRNSWGQDWGDRGYCYIPFQLMAKCSPPEGFWIIGELAKPGNYSVIRPGKDAAATGPVAALSATKSSGISEKAAKMREEIRASLDKEIDASSRRIEKILSGTTGNKIVLSKQKFGDEWVCPTCGYVSDKPGYCPNCQK